MKKYILYILLALFIATPVCAQHRIVSYKQGFYSPEHGGMPLYPDLWKKSPVGIWAPPLGVTGNRLLDVSGFGNDGILTNMNPATDWIIGENGYALNYADDNGHVFINKAVVTSTPLSIVCWFNADNATDLMTPVIIQWSTGNQRMYRILLRGDVGGDPVQAQVQNNVGGGSGIASSSAGFTANTWNQGVVVFESPTSRKAYINGGNEGIDTTSITDPAGLNETRIGATFNEGTGIGEEMVGKIGIVIIYNRVLLPSEIRQNYIDQLALFRTRRLAIGRVPDGAPPTGIPILRRRMEACLSCHDDRFLAVNNDVFCPEENRLEYAFND